jgi:cytosine/adenosine deaminase-related metal-dependent hydrolase
MTPEDGLASSSLCVLEMIKSGTTGFIEVLLAEHYGFSGIAEMIEKSGIRAALGKIVMDMDPAIRDEIGMHPNMWETRDASIQSTLKMYERWNGAADGRIQVWFGARTAGEWNKPDMYDEISQLARERNMGITIHFAETPEDVAYAKSQGFRSPTEFGMAHGILGPRTVLAHYIHSNEEDWKLLVQTGTTISHNPGSNQREPWGPAPVARMLKAGVNVSMGCDAAVANNAMDMVRDLRVALHATRMFENDQAAMSPETALELATINGAIAMGIEDQVGSIEPGKKADFIIIDLDKPHLQPVWNPVATLALSALGSDVDTVIIDGKIIMQGRKVQTMDEEAILADIRERKVRLAKKAGIEMHLQWPVL